MPSDWEVIGYAWAEEINYYPANKPMTWGTAQGPSWVQEKIDDAGSLLKPLIDEEALF